MVFKLIRTDSEDPCKIQLPLGTHLIGRGKFLDCDDKRVSRKHGELEVVDDTIRIKALHQNPCFYIKKGTTDMEVLKQNCTISLTHGDKFGLLPDTYWYELLHCTLDEQSPSQSTQILEEVNGDNAQQNEDVPANQTIPTKDENTTCENSDDEEMCNLVINEIAEATQRSDSPSLILAASPTRQLGSPSLTQKEEDPLNNEQEQDAQMPLHDSNVSTSTEDYTVNPPTDQPDQQSPTKRSHSPEDSKEGIKKVKVEQDPDAQAGPSADQGNAPPAANGNAATPPSPAKPNVAGRERCIYGANCYRKNPVHKAQFAHPTDPDWGPGAQGVCPWGVGCQRRDPRHWQDHTHPPGVVPPAPQNRPGMQVVQRHGNVFYINAHSVNFYDDRFQVEDSDGDSVDYDYEF